MSSTHSRAVLIGGLSMLRSFAGLKIPTVVISRYARDVGRYSRYCDDWRTTFLNSEWNESYFLETLIGIANEGPDMPVLYYGDDPIDFISLFRAQQPLLVRNYVVFAAKTGPTTLEKQ